MTGTILATNKVLVVDDDVAVRALVKKALSADSVQVLDAASGPDALDLINGDEPDLIILDIGLPGTSGLDVLVEIRRTSEVPVVLLTGRSDEADRIAGLDLGADDYVVKPFYPGELAARVRSLLRRARPPVDDQLSAGDIEIDRNAREVRVHGELLDLTAKEYDLLTFLVQSPRRVFNREQLLRNVWESSSEWQDPATVTEHVRRIRNKLEATKCEAGIATVRGVGYRFEPAVGTED
ncbi:MAG: response regulator [Actinomycetota bacterium]